MRGTLPGGDARPAGGRGSWPRSPAMPDQRDRRRGPGRSAVRVVLADDSVLFREGLARLLADTASRWSARPATPTRCTRWSRGTTPDVVVTDIRMPPDQLQRRACWPRSGSAPSIPAWASWCCPSTSRPGRRSGCSRTRRSASATCSRTGCRTSRSSPTTVRRIARGGIGDRSRRWWRSCSAGGARTARWTSSPAGSATSSP